MTRSGVALAILVSVLYGLAARLSFDETLPIAVPMTFTFIFLVPFAVGYLSVGASRGEGKGELKPVLVIPMGTAMVRSPAMIELSKQGLNRMIVAAVTDCNQSPMNHFSYRMMEIGGSSPERREARGAHHLMRDLENSPPSPRPG